MSDLDFGMDVQSNTYITDLLETLPKLKGDDPSSLLKDIYEVHYGICDHLSPEVKTNRPFASIGKHPSEDLKSLRGESDIRKLFLEKDVHKHTGITYSEFMEMTSSEITDVIEYVEKRMASEANAINNLGLSTKK